MMEREQQKEKEDKKEKEDIKEETKHKVKLFTHTDLDGVGCAVLACLVFGRENVDVEYCNYKDVDDKVREFFYSFGDNNYDTVFITDISISDELAMRINYSASSRKFHLFDHHATAIGLNKYRWCYVTIENADLIKTSGTELFWLYLVNNGYFDKLSDYREDALKNISRFVEIVRDYDTWRWKEELGEEGIICKQINDLLYIFGREYFINWMISCIAIDDSDKFPLLYGEPLALLNQRQKDIDRYIEKKDKQLIILKDQFGHSCGVVFAEQYFSEIGNKLCELHPELDYVSMIDICKGTVSYRSIREDIDLGGEIAHSFGGGGHQKAAGSTFDGKLMMEMVIYGVFQNKCNLMEVEVVSGD